MRVLSPSQLGFSDFRGNRQYISAGNIAAQKHVVLFFMDDVSRERLKVWAEARIVLPGEDPALESKLSEGDYRARIAQCFVFDVQAYDWNCPQHITPFYTTEEIAERARRPIQR